MTVRDKRIPTAAIWGTMIQTVTVRGKRIPTAAVWGTMILTVTVRGKPILTVAAGWAVGASIARRQAEWTKKLSTDMVVIGSALTAARVDKQLRPGPVWINSSVRGPRG